MFRFFAACPAIFSMALGLSACGGSNTSGEAENIDYSATPSPMPTPAPADEQSFAVYELYTDGGNHVYVQAQLSSNDPALSPTEQTDYIRLATSEQLLASAGGTIDELSVGGDLFAGLADAASRYVELVHSTDLPQFLNSRINYLADWYTGRLPYAEDDYYHVALTLPSGESPEDSWVLFPPSFEISPLPDVFSRATDTLTVSWSPTDPDSTIVAVGLASECPSSETSFSHIQVVTYDQGFHTFDAGALQASQGEPLGQCETMVTVLKTRLGSLDPQFSGGYISASQYRYRIFTSSD